MRSLRITLLAIGLLSLSIAPASSETRLALVIGNSQYDSPHLGQLSTPRHDMQVIAEVLKRRLSYTVFGGSDLTLDEMKQKLAEFTNTIRQAGRNTTAVIFYSGHGMEVGEENYLFPIDALGPFTASNISSKAIGLAWLLNEVSGAGASVSVVILDACRNDGTKGGDPSKGFRPVANPPGTIVAFATAPGQVALDRNSNANGASYYSATLANVLAIENLSAFEVLSKVRDEVYRLTKGEQIPWERIELQGRPFAFNPSLELAVIPQLSISPTQTACERHIGTFEVSNVADWDHLNIRREPRLPLGSERSNVIAKVPFGAKGIDVKASTCNAEGWCEVQYLCSKGYANIAFMRAMADAANPAVRVAAGAPYLGTYRVHGVDSNEPLNLREDPNYKSPVVVEIPYNAQSVELHTCRLIGSKDKWCFVSYERKQGWVNSAYLRNIESGDLPQ